MLVVALFKIRVIPTLRSQSLATGSLWTLELWNRRPLRISQQCRQTTSIVSTAAQPAAPVRQVSPVSGAKHVSYLTFLSYLDSTVIAFSG
jgi:hypothetical protein